ncbi:MAG: hypothetical protein JWM72_1120 [Actinomycetia bacterium]|nr:hypothetical protein [Actinomycetes bacterium]
MNPKNVSGTRRRRWVIPVVVVVVGVVALGGFVVRQTTRTSNTAAETWVTRENRRPGTSAWRIATTAYGGVGGYANRVSAQIGEAVTLYVSTAAPVFHVEAFRMGWYQGLGGRLVWRSAEIRGEAQRPATVVKTTRTVTTTWKPSLHVQLSKDWIPGDYLLKLVTSKGQSYIPLTVRNDASRAPLLMMNAVTTWQAYNDWGGHSLYFGPNADPAARSTVVSFDRPYNWAVRQGGYPPVDPQAYEVCCGFVATELGVVTEVERLGLDVAYTTDIDVQEHPAQLLRHRALISGGHDEYWSVAKRNAVEAARDHGVNIMFLGPNAVYWRIRLEPSRLGANRLEVNYRIARDDPMFGKDDAQVTTLWRSPPKARPEGALVGVMYYCFGSDDDGVVADASSWVFDGTGLKNGDHIAKLIEREADHVDPALPAPPGIQKLLHSPVSCLGLGGRRASGPAYFSDTTYYTTKSGSGVFATGAPWNCKLYDGCPSGTSHPDKTVQRITENVMRAFAAGPAGRAHPSHGSDAASSSP